MERLKLKRGHQKGDTGGHWLTADEEFFVYTVSGKWKLSYRRQERHDWLWEHGLYDLSFPTRRAALERLQDTLLLDPPPPLEAER